ncbi:tetratricopeptide repeat protein [Simiduia agarivorans]|uniref:tetratricopeptide repeat protein n=1 Tax=Simiduia agarivorans TaxID=447471 RepID=UPI00146D387C|nr:tetratricopeptide repeat protein [Simiduia agarivorans]
MLLTALLLALGGCVTLHIEQPDQKIIAQAVSGALIPGFERRDIPSADTVSRLNDNMRSFVDEWAPASMTTNDKVKSLLRGLISSQGRAIQYRSDITLDAESTFEQAVANCLSFSILYASMAESAGLRVAFNKVEVPPLWGLREDSLTLTSYQHVNVIVEHLGYDQVVDINMQEYSVDYPQKRISKEKIIALFYNNNAVNAMDTGDYGLAMSYYRAGLALDWSASEIWNNLGVLHMRINEYDVAVELFKMALSLNTRELSAATNLVRVYQYRGEKEEADKVLRAVQGYQKNNPYFYYRMSVKKLDERNFNEALADINKAVKLLKDHRFYYVRSRVLQAMGGYEESMQSLELAIQVATSEYYRLYYLSEKEKFNARAEEGRAGVGSELL